MGDGLVMGGGGLMGDVSVTTSTVGTKYISRYFTVEQRLYVKIVILRGTEGVEYYNCKTVRR